MPNAKLPIQRASSTWEASASSALPTRIRKTFPATSCASRLSPPSARQALRRAKANASDDAGGAGAMFSEPINATGSLRAGGGRVASDGKAIAPDWQGIVKIRLDGAVCADASRHFELCHV